MSQTINIIFGATAVGGTADAITATYSPVLTALTDKRTLSFKAAANNTGAVTFSPDGLTVRNVTKRGGSALVSGDILQNGVYIIQYDSTNTRWEIINPSGYQPLDSDLTAIAALTPSNDDILQRKSGAWTNRTMAQLGADLTASTLIGYKGYALSGYWSTALSPADSTTYYFGSLNSATTTGGLRRVYIPKSGTVKAAYLFGTWVTGTAELSTFQIRVNNTSSTSVGTFAGNVSPFIANSVALNISVSQGDYIEFQIDTPAWSSNPTTMTGYGIIYIE